jgi:hypothetical protein
LSVVSATDGTPVNVSSMSYNAQTNTATFALATPIADGNYLATLNGTSTTDAVGNSLAGGNAQLPFFVLPGDINRDGVVNALDFNTLATNFGSAGGFAQGDVDFNGTINTADFTILAAHFGTNVNPSGSNPLAANPASGSLFSSVTVADKDSDPLSLAGNA